MAYKEHYGIKTNPFNFAKKIFKPYEQLSAKNVQKIDKVVKMKHLTIESSVFDGLKDGKLLLFWSPMGSGKTSNAFDYCIKNGYKLISINSLCSLVSTESRWDL